MDVVVLVGFVQKSRDDVVDVVWAGKDGVTLAHIAKDCDAHEVKLSTCVRQVDVEDGEKPGAPERGRLRTGR